MPEKAKTSKAKRPVQYAVLPFRRGKDGLRLLLITSRETCRWVLPKGWPMKGRKPYEAAAREAYEEAGLVGVVGKRSVGTYCYAKRLKDGSSVLTDVKVYPFEIIRRKKRWPERGERGDEWFTPADAALAVAEEALSEILLAFAPRPLVRKKARKAKVLPPVPQLGPPAPSLDGPRTATAEGTKRAKGERRRPRAPAFERAMAAPAP